MKWTGISHRGKSILLLLFLAAFGLLTLTLTSTSTYSFDTNGCQGDCTKCHSLSNQEVDDVLKKMNILDAKVMDIQLSPVKSLWEISIENKGKRGIFYVDFSKKYLLLGPIIEVATRSNKTSARLEKLEEGKRVDVSGIPLNNALVMGDTNASKRVIVFTDPDCPFCAKFHVEMKKILQERADIAFYLKLYPLNIHKDAYWKSKSIVCNKSIQMLEDNFEKKAIPKTDCDTDEIDDNIKLAESLGITGTPTLILPDGRVYAGMLPAGKLIELIDGSPSPDKQ